MLDLLDNYRTKTGQPIVTMMPEGGAMGGGLEAIVKARQHVSNRGFAVYPNFERGANALGKVVSYWATNATR